MAFEYQEDVPDPETLKAMEAEEQRLLEISRAYAVCFLGEDAKLTPEARIVLAHMMQAAGMLRDQTEANPNVLLVNEGGRHVIHTAMRALSVDPANFLISLKLQHHE